MSKDKDPRIDHPGRPDPEPPGRSEHRSSGAGRGDDPGRTKQVKSEAEEPIENRFPDDDSGEHRESG